MEALFVEVKVLDSHRSTTYETFIGTKNYYSISTKVVSKLLGFEF